MGLFILEMTSIAWEVDTGWHFESTLAPFPLPNNIMSLGYQLAFGGSGKVLAHK